MGTCKMRTRKEPRCIVRRGLLNENCFILPVNTVRLATLFAYNGDALYPLCGGIMQLQILKKVLRVTYANLTV